LSKKILNYDNLVREKLENIKNFNNANLNNSNKSSMQKFENTNKTEIFLLIKKLKNKSNNNELVLCNSFVKVINSQICIIFSFFVNLFYNVAYIPLELKKALILPKHKKVKKNNILNYRPIANINVLAKLLVRNILIRIQKLAYVNNLIDSNQFAYQKNISINEAVITKTDFIYNAFNENKNVLAIYLDLTRAFETINHKILLAKLENYGFHNKSLKLLEDYFCDRKQITIVNKHYSDSSSVKVGVPQGTILGPWLFILFLNDIFKTSSLPKIICFADDTLLLYTIEKNCKLLSHEINSSLNNIANWFDSNLLLLNENKSNFMLYSITAKNELPKLTVTLGYKIIEETYSFKYLGLNFAPNLKWSVHINTLLTKLKIICKLITFLR
jgi:Reverse transcriptase (RNA-dependent DNA polymerase)